MSKCKMSINGNCCLICPYFANSKECGISYHRFPKSNPDKWLKVFDITSDSIATCKIKSARLCSRHFTEDDFISHGNNGSRKYLKKDSIPSIVFIDEKQLSLRKHSLFTGEVVCEPFDIEEKENITKRNILLGNFGKPIWRRSCFLCKRQDKSDLSFFMFPKDERKNAWLAACNITSSIPKIAFLCNRHFNRDDFYENTSRNQRPRLRKTAVPSVFFNKAKMTDRNTALSHKTPNLGIQNDGIAMNSEVQYPDMQVDTLPEIQRHNTGEVINSYNGMMEIDYDGENENVINISRHSMNDLSTESATALGSVYAEHENASSSRISMPLSDALSLNIPSESVLVNDILTPKQIPITQHKQRKVRYPGDIGLAQIESPRSAKKSVKFLKTVVKQKSRTIYDLKRKLFRRNKRISNLHTAIINLKKLNVLQADRADHLSV